MISKRFIKITVSVTVLAFSLIPSGLTQTLEVKQGRSAIVKSQPLGNSPQIARLESGTKVTQIGNASRYYSILMANGDSGWSYKGNFNLVEDSPTSSLPTTKEVLLSRNDVLKIIVMDVEVGDSTIIICPEESGIQDILLIDTGENDDDRILDELRKNGFSLLNRPITRFYASHYDGDHIGGIKGIAPFCKIAYDHGPNREKSYYKKALKENSVDRRTISLNYNETFSGGVVVECLASNRANDHNPSHSPSSDENTNSIALHVGFDGFDYFTAGDLTFEVEEDLANLNINFDVYHVNHHGSRTTSSGLEFLQSIDPEVSVVSNGTRYGHPTAEVANRLINQIQSTFYQTNINKDSRAHQPDPKFVADDTLLSSSQENSQGAKGNITIVVDPGKDQYFVVMPGLALNEGTFAIER